MKYRILSIIISIVFFTFSNVFSQEDHTAASTIIRAVKANSSKPTYLKMTVRNAPSLTIQFSGGYNFGVFELSGNNNGDFSPKEFTVGENFGVRHGIGGNLTMKIPLHEKGNLRLDVSVLFNYFSSKFSKANTGTSPSDYVLYRVYSGEIGLENNFTPNYRFKTLVGAGIVGSVISGDATLTDATLTGQNDTKNLTVIPAFRLGVSLYSGVEYAMSNKLGLNFGFKFTHANLWFKQTKESSDPNKIYLNDQREVPRPQYSGFKQFAWGSFYAGVNVYFGVTPKEYIFRK